MGSRSPAETCTLKNAQGGKFHEREEECFGTSPGGLLREFPVQKALSHLFPPHRRRDLFRALLADGEAIGFPDIIERERQKGKKVAVFPVSENDWMDMGQLPELEKMRKKLYGE